MKKIVITVMVLLAGLASAQLPATMNALGIGLPNGVLRMEQDRCDDTIGVFASVTEQQYECFWSGLNHSRAFRHQYLQMQVAGYELLREEQLNQWIVAQSWWHDTKPIVDVVYEFNSAAELVAIGFLWY